jgi:hypothetical protein
MTGRWIAVEKTQPAVAVLLLLDDVRRRHPGGELYCPYMQALDEAIKL